MFKVIRMIHGLPPCDVLLADFCDLTVCLQPNSRTHEMSKDNNAKVQMNANAV